MTDRRPSGSSGVFPEDTIDPTADDPESSDHDPEVAPMPSRISSAALLGLVPIVWAIVLPLTAGARSVFDASVVIGSTGGNDEVGYWHQAASFRAFGFGTGQYGFEEVGAPAAFTPFGPHGPWPPMLYGSIGRVVGWGLTTPIIVNIVIAVLGTASIGLILRPSREERAVIAAVLLVLWPAWATLVTGLQEPLHVAAACVIASLIVKYLRTDRGLAPLLIAILVASIFRPTWALVAIPVAIHATRKLTIQRRLTWLGATAVTAATPFVLFSWTAAAYPYSPTADIMNSGSPGAGVRQLSRTVTTNMTRLADPAGRFAVHQGFRVVFVVAATIVVVGAVSRHRRAEPEERAFWSLAFWAITTFAVMTFATYSTGDPAFRIWTPHLLLLVLLAVSQRPVAVRTIGGLIALYAAITLPLFLNAYPHTVGDRYEELSAGALNFAHSLEPVEVVATDSRWCNTLLWRGEMGEVPDDRVLVPAGIGVNYDIEHRLTPPVRSRWVIADPEWGGESSTTGLIPRAQTEWGVLYENTAAGCDQ